MEKKCVFKTILHNVFIDLPWYIAWALSLYILFTLVWTFFFYLIWIQEYNYMTILSVHTFVWMFISFLFLWIILWIISSINEYLEYLYNNCK